MSGSGRSAKKAFRAPAAAFTATSITTKSMLWSTGGHKNKRQDRHKSAITQAVASECQSSLNKDWKTRAAGKKKKRINTEDGREIFITSCFGPKVMKGKEEGEEGGGGLSPEVTGQLSHWMWGSANTSTHMVMFAHTQTQHVHLRKGKRRREEIEVTEKREGKKQIIRSTKETTVMLFICKHFKPTML